MPVYLVPPLVHTMSGESNKGPLITGAAWADVLAMHLKNFGPPGAPKTPYRHGRMKFHNHAEAYLEGVRRQYWPLSGLEAVLQSIT